MELPGNSAELKLLVIAQKTALTWGSYVLVLRPMERKIPATMVCRVQMFMWAFCAPMYGPTGL